MKPTLIIALIALAGCTEIPPAECTPYGRPMGCETGDSGGYAAPDVGETDTAEPEATE